MTTRASLPSFSAIFDQSFAAFKERFWIFLVLWLISGVAYAVSGALGALALKVFAPPAPPPETVAPLAAEAPAPSAAVPAAAPVLDYPEACKAELAMFCEGRADKGAAACLALVPDGLLAPCKDALARLGAAN